MTVAEEGELWQHHVEHSVPSLEDTMRAVAKNRYLSAVLTLVHGSFGWGAVDVIDAEVARHASQIAGYLHRLTYREKLAIVPYLRRLGFGLTLFRAADGTLDDEAASREGNAPNYDCPFQINITYGFKLKNCDPSVLMNAELRPTDPRRLRIRGLLRCAPRLLILSRRAMERCNAPGGAGAAAAGQSFKCAARAMTGHGSSGGGGDDAADASEAPPTKKQRTE